VPRLQGTEKHIPLRCPFCLLVCMGGRWEARCHTAISLRRSSALAELCCSAVTSGSLGEGGSEVRGSDPTDMIVTTVNHVHVIYLTSGSWLYSLPPRLSHSRLDFNGFPHRRYRRHKSGSRSGSLLRSDLLLFRQMGWHRTFGTRWQE